MRPCTRRARLLRLVLVATCAAWLGVPRPAAAQVMDKETYSLVLLELFEFQLDGEGNPLHLDGAAWVGGDTQRLWLLAEGAKATHSRETELDAQVLYGRLISPFWDAVGGVGVETRLGTGESAVRAQLVLGLLGLAPYWFELEPLLFVSHRGDVSARVTASYDMFLTQRLVAQPRLEVDAAVQNVPEFGVGRGLSSVELGLRLRYEARRELAPYVGVSWTRRLGQTASYAREDGEGVSILSFVVGARLWQ